MKQNLKRLVGATLIASAMGLGAVGGAFAANPDGVADALPIGQTNYLNSNPFGFDNQVGNNPLNLTIAASLLNVAFSSPTFSGTVDSWVVSGDSHNPLGGLDFVYQFTNSASSPDAIQRMVVNGFAGFLTDVGEFRPLDVNGNIILGVFRQPTSVDRNSPNSIGWNFLPNPQCSPLGCVPTPGSIAPGVTTVLMIVYTNAVNWHQENAVFIDGSVTSGASLAPTAAIPEPETYAMMLAGLGLMGFVARRRKKNPTV